MKLVDQIDSVLQYYIATQMPLSDLFTKSSKVVLDTHVTRSFDFITDMYNDSTRITDATELVSTSMAEISMTIASSVMKDIWALPKSKVKLMFDQHTRPKSMFGYDVSPSFKFPENNAAHLAIVSQDVSVKLMTCGATRYHGRPQLSTIIPFAVLDDGCTVYLDMNAIDPNPPLAAVASGMFGVYNVGNLHVSMTPGMITIEFDYGYILDPLIKVYESEPECLTYPK